MAAEKSVSEIFGPHCLHGLGRLYLHAAAGGAAAELGTYDGRGHGYV